MPDHSPEGQALQKTFLATAAAGLIGLETFIVTAAAGVIGLGIAHMAGAADMEMPGKDMIACKGMLRCGETMDKEAMMNGAAKWR